MTNKQLAENFLRRFLSVRESDVVELEALLDIAEERGAAKVEWSFNETTSPGKPSDMLELIEISKSVEIEIGL